MCQMAFDYKCIQEIVEFDREEQNNIMLIHNHLEWIDCLKSIDILFIYLGLLTSDTTFVVVIGPPAIIGHPGIIIPITLIYNIFIKFI